MLLARADEVMKYAKTATSFAASAHGSFWQTANERLAFIDVKWKSTQLLGFD
jgi:hypothetical protein